MNANCYKVIFSKRLGALVAVGEHAASSGKAASGQASRGVASPSSCATIAWGGFVGALRFSFASVALACLSIGSTQAQSIRPPLASNALPTGASINAGSASISTSGAQMAITQSTDKTSINWNSFNIGSGASVNIAQPSSSSVLLNRVVGQDPSQIFGKLSANGQVILLNPNGIAFGRDGSVTATSFTASTFNLTDADFMSGFYKYNRNGSTATIVNEGTIETSAGGFVALIGASVTNDGKIIAPQGNVVLAAAESVTLPDAVTATQSSPASTVSVPLSKKVRLELLPATINAAITNTPSGVIVTDGGQVLLQAAAISTAVASITHSGSIDTSGNQGGAVQVLAENGNIKVNGSITANSTGSDNNNQPLKGGDIIIGRDEQTGALAKATDVSGARLESNKGFVETSGQHLDSLGVNVKAGQWLLDPTDINIVSADTATANTPKTNASGTDTYQQTGAVNTSEILNTDISTALSNGTNVLIKTTNGSATGSGDITVSANINATSATAQDATLTLQAERDIVVNNTISRTGSNKLNVILNSDLDGNGTGIIRLNSGASISSNGGNITLGGGSAGDGTGYARGYSASSRAEGVVLFGANLAASGGNIAIKGQGSASTPGGTFQAMGVNVTGTSSVSTTGAGNITITGQGGNGSDTNAGVGIHASSTVTGSTTGTVTLTGTGGNGGNYDFGVWLSDTGSKATSIGGSVIVNGTGGGSGGSGQHDGVMVQNYANLGATGTGTVTITGTAAGTGTGAGGGNSNGVELLVYGSITAGSGNINITGNANVAAAPGNGVALNSGGNISSAGNITIQGNSSTNGMGVNMAAGSSVTSSGANATIGISSNNLMVHSGAITTTNSTGTGTNINLTAATGGITGGGTIGNSTNKNASVSLSTATTGSFSGGINALNFTKAGAGTLTLDSWAQPTPVMTNVSNSYNINAGRLNLNTGGSYYTVNTKFININNATTFGATGSNGTWSGNTFVFDSVGGGTLAWSGNPIMNVGTAALTFKTNGGNTNNITGYFNMNAGTADVTFDVAAASTPSNPGLLISGAGGGFTNSWSHTINKTGSGMVRMLNNLQTPTLNVNAGTWEFGDGSTGAGSYSVTAGNVANYNIASGATLSFNTPSAVTMTNPSTTFAGAGTIVKKGAGSIQWGAGAATFNLSTGSLIDVQGGTFVGSSSANEVWSSNNSSLNIASGATFRTIEGQIQVDALNGTGALVLGTTSSAYTSRMTVGVQGGSGAFSGAISNIASFNNGTFYKVGAGTQSLTGANTYTGATTVSGGTLQITNMGSFYSNAIAIASGAVFEANVATNTNYSASTAVSGAGTFRKTGSAGLAITGGGQLTFGNNAGGLIDIQTGLIQNNNLQANLANNLASINIASGAVLDIRDEAVQMNGLSGAGSIFNSWQRNATGANTITLGVGASSADTNTFSGIIGSTVVDATMFPNTATNYSGSAALANGRSSAVINVVKTNTASTQIFTGANAYSGTTTVNGGTLQIGDGVGGAGHTSSIGAGAITIDGANTTLSFKNLAPVTLSSSQTVTGNGTLISDKPLTLSGKISILKSSVDGNANLTIKTTDTNVSSGSADLNINAAVIKGDANNTSFTAQSATSLTLNGNIGNKTTDASNATGTLDVSLTSLGGGINNNYSYGLYLNKVIDANGGVATLTSTVHNSNAANGTAAINFYNGSGITAGSFTATGNQTFGNVNNTRQGIAFSGTTNFTTTGSGISKFSGTTNEGQYFMSTGIYTSGTINLDSGSNGGQIVMEGTSMPFTSGTRSEAAINTKGNVTLGKSDANMFQRIGTITAQTGTLNIIGNSISTYNATAAIKGSDGTTVNLTAPSITLGSGTLASEGGPSIGLASGSTGFSLNIITDNLAVNTNGTPLASNNSGSGTTTIRNFSTGTKFNIGGSDAAAVGATQPPWA